MGGIEREVLNLLVEVGGYLQSLEFACKRNLGCMNEGAVESKVLYVVRRNGVISIWTYIRDPRYVRDDVSWSPRCVFVYLGTSLDLRNNNLK